MPYSFDESHVKFNHGLGISDERDQEMREEVSAILNNMGGKSTAGVLRNAVKHIPQTMEECYWMGGLIESFLFSKSHQTLAVE